MTHKLKAVRVIVSGRVQGVFFRSGVKREADSNGLVGWVRNLPTGEVEALLQGEDEQVDRVLEWCRTGPKNSEVSSVQILAVNPSSFYHNFAIVY